MTYVGLFILIGSHLVSQSIEAMATKTLFDVVAERVCKDDRLFASVRSRSLFLAASLEMKYSQVYSDSIRTHLHTIWQLFSERIELIGHSRTVLASDFLNDQIITGDAGGTLCVRSIDKPALFNSFACHRDAIRAVAVRPTEGVFCTGSRDKTVRLWQLNEDGPRAVWTAGHPEEVSHVAFNNSGTIVAAACSNGLVYLWNRSTGELLRHIHLAAKTALGFSADDRQLVAVDIGFIREFTLEKNTCVVGGTSCCAPAAFVSQGEHFLLKSEGRGTLESNAEVVQTGLFETYEMIGCLSVDSSLNMVTFGILGAGNAPGNKKPAGFIRVNNQNTVQVPMQGYVTTTALGGPSCVIFGGKDGELVLMKLNLKEMSLQEALIICSSPGLTPHEAHESLRFMHRFLAPDGLLDRGLMKEQLRHLPTSIVAAMERAYGITFSNEAYRSEDELSCEGLPGRRQMLVQSLLAAHASKKTKSEIK